MNSNTSGGRGSDDPPVVRLIRRLSEHIDAGRKRQFALLLCLMVFSSLAEMLSIGAVLPFLSALTQPDVVFEQPTINAVARALGIDAASQVALPLTLAFCAATIVAAGMRVLLTWASTRLSFAFGSDLSNKVYRGALYQSYFTHISRNSSEVIDVIWIKVSEVIFYVLLPVMQLVSSAIIVTVICAALFLAIPKVALLAFACLAVAYAGFIKLVKRRLRDNSRLIADESSNMVKTLQEGFGGIRDVLIDGSQETFSATYRAINQRLRHAQGDNQIISVSPRYVVEALGMLLVAGLAFSMSTQPSGMAAAVPVLAAMALGLQRLLPAAQQLYNAWSLIHGARASLEGVLRMLGQPSTLANGPQPQQPVPFTKHIALKHVSFRYSEQASWILQDVNLTIAKGARIGVIGETGCGKSTLLDIVMGLLQPTDGVIEVDGERLSAESTRAWQMHIAHVPQTVYLADCSIAENIAFGVAPQLIDMAQVRRVAEQAQLAKVVESWPSKYRTRVGERGIQLSGGQRQRIGIARALYKNADLIIFDEATSALDSETEDAVMRSIQRLDGDVTLLIIAHRLNTLDACSEILELRKEGMVMSRRGEVSAVH